MKRSRKRIAPRATAPLALMRGIGRPRLLVAVVLLGAAAISVWALLPTVFVEERDEPVITSVAPESSSSMSQQAVLPTPEPAPAEMPYTKTDTSERHVAFALAASAFNPDGEVDVPETVSVQTRAPVVVWDMQLSDDLTEYFPGSSIRAANAVVDDGGPRLLWFGNESVPSKGLALNATSVFAEDDWLGVFLVGLDGECRWQTAESMWVVEDAFGVHPLLVDRAKQRWESLLAGPFIGVKQEGLIDWSNVPARGDQFDRQWRRQLHLTTAPARDGMIFRYEGGHRYLPRKQRGRGNSAHHWNLLAYAINEIPETAVSEQLSSEQCIGDLMRGLFPKEWVDRYQARFSKQWYEAVSKRWDPDASQTNE